MESYCLKIHGDTGTLNQEKTVVPWNGPFLTINPPHVIGAQRIFFTRVAVDVKACHFVAGDNQGNIYVFDISKNKYQFVCHIDRSSTCIAIIPHQIIDIIVATSDCRLLFVDSDTNTVKNVFQLHKSCVNNISLDRAKTRAITSSSDVAILWDLVKVSALHVLKLKKNIDILKAMFLPVRDYFVSAFKDGSVIMWNSRTLHEVLAFNCHDANSSWLRTIAASHNGDLIICGGKKDWLLLWSVVEKKFLHSISLSPHMSVVKQVAFLSPFLGRTSKLIASVLSPDGKMHYLDVYSAELLFKLETDDAKIASFCESNGKMAVINSLGLLKIYDLHSLLSKDEQVKGHIPKLKIPEKKILHEKKKKQEKKPKDEQFKGLSRKELEFLLKDCGKYPDKFRVEIWSKLLMLPSNREFTVYYRSSTTLPHKDETVDYTLHRMLHMLNEWCPVMGTIDFLPSMIQPFTKCFGKNYHFCFELLVTYITSWCQNWFFYLPHYPFNIIYAIDNILLHHDRQLFHHFILHDISSEVYAFILLQTSFSNVFNEDQWFELWDNIFSKSPEFLLFITVAFILKFRDIFLNCSTEAEVKDFLQFYPTIAAAVVEKANELKSSTPMCFSPKDVAGPFKPIPKNAYPPFRKFTVIKSFLPILHRQRTLDVGVEYVDIRKRLLEQDIIEEGSEKEASLLAEVKFLELQQLHGILVDYVLKSTQRKQLDELESLDDKVKRTQNAIQKLLVSSVEKYQALQDKLKAHKGEVLSEHEGEDASASQNPPSEPASEESVQTTDSCMPALWETLKLRQSIAKM